jgi:glycosyltransferase involved in cell wall biosynthesis
MPRVSVGLPVYNGEPFLEAALDSLLDQTFEDFELLISDNASTDNTETICRAAAARDRRVVYSRNDVNVGAARNFNIVLQRATGEYFRWAAHDDACRPDFLLKCVEALDSDDGAVLAYTRAIQLEETGTRHLPCELDVAAGQPTARFAHVVSSPRNWWLPIFGLMRRSVLGSVQYGNYPGADHVFLAGLSLYGRFLEVPDELFVHRHHTERYTARYRSGSSWVEKLKYWDPVQSAGPYRWWRLRGYYGVVATSPLGPLERLRCYGSIARWGVKHRRGLVGDAVRGPASALARAHR